MVPESHLIGTIIVSALIVIGLVILLFCFISECERLDKKNMLLIGRIHNEEEKYQELEKQLQNEIIASKFRETMR